MLDIELFREEPERIRESERRRGKDPDRVDRVAELDREWRETRQELDELRHERNEVSDRIGELKQEGEDAEEEIQRMQEVKEKIAELEGKEERLKEERDEERYRVGNILHEDVPPGEDEDDAEELRQWGEKPGIDDPLHHADLVEEFDLVDTDTAGEVSGSRFYYMKDDLVKLHLAVQQYALDKLQGEGFQRMYTPFMLKHEQMEA
ncbi:MAG: serine--tRNA ligase, partial [Candidatus Nanohaloarchaea archaeon]|nr:serine--tRNA ligase [Candidatus Nanohaloarchaea archaeon]